MSNLRSSARLKSKAAPPPAVTTSSSKPAKHKALKRVKTSREAKANHASPTAVERRTKGTRGSLSFITEMPLDILLETFNHLEPVDLLHLSRACKSLRKMLWTPNANRIWKQSFSNILRNAPPEMPADMSYPAYALLFFGTDCHGCGAQNTPFVYWTVRMRLCGSCFEERATKSNDLDWTQRSLIPVLRRLKPSRRSYEYFYLKEDIEKMKEELKMSEADPKLRKELMDSHRKFINEREQFYRHCLEWERNLKRTRKNDIETLRSKRKDAICERLRQEGWGAEVDFLGSKAANLPGADKTQALTDKIWSNLHEEVIAFIEEIRVIRLAKERLTLIICRMDLLKPLYQAYMSTQPYDVPHPEFADICRQPPFRDLIFSTPSSSTLTAADFEVHKESISTACTNWVQASTKMLEALLPPECPSIGLAIALFRCYWCTEPIHYPRVLNHRCLVTTHDGLQIPDDHPDKEFGTLQSWHFKPWNWGGEQVEFDEQASKYATDIIRVCGQDPQIASKEDMDQLDCRIECLRCTKGRPRYAMRWSMALLHEIGQHYEEKWEGPKWKLFEDEAEKALIKEKEAAELKSWQPPVGCRHCGLTTNAGYLFTHLRQQHDMYDVVESEAATHTFVPLDTSLSSVPRTAKLPRG